MQKYIVAGLAVVAAVAALVWRPPQADFATAPSQAPRSVRPLTSPAGRRAPATVVVYVAGEVLRPGVYTLPATARGDAALARAGGPRSDADLIAVNLAEPLTDGMEIAVPKIGAAADERRTPAGPRRRRAHGPRAHRRSHHRTPPAERGASGGSVTSIDLNAADESQLETLPGIGPALAARIVEYRDVNGPFTSTDELGDVSGITPSLQESITPYLTVH